MSIGVKYIPEWATVNSILRCQYISISLRQTMLNCVRAEVCSRRGRRRDPLHITNTVRSLEDQDKEYGNSDIRKGYILKGCISLYEGLSYTNLTRAKYYMASTLFDTSLIYKHQSLLNGPCKLSIYIYRLYRDIYWYITGLYTLLYLYTYTLYYLWLLIYTNLYWRHYSSTYMGSTRVAI